MDCHTVEIFRRNSYGVRCFNYTLCSVFISLLSYTGMYVIMFVLIPAQSTLTKGVDRLLSSGVLF